MARVVSLINCKVYVKFKPVKTVSAVTAVDGKVHYVGDSEKASRIAKLLGGRVLDLDGSTVMPGFIDAHMHLDGLGVSLNNLDLRGAKSIAEVKERLRDFAARTTTEWIRGRGWDQELFAEGRWISRWDIDEVVPDRPVLLVRVCGHVGVLNSKALELVKEAGLRAEPPYFEVDEKGRPTGVVREAGLDEVLKLIKYSEQDMLKFIEDAVSYVLRHGVTTVGLTGCGPEALSALQLLDSMGRLKARVRAYLNQGMLPCLKTLGIRCGFGDSALKVLGIKVFADGSLGARTALLSEPYTDDPATKGLAVHSEEELTRVIEEASEAGLQVATHAIGDGAIDLVLKAYSSVWRYVKALRHRVEHASVIRTEQIKKLAELGAAVAIQPHFVITDWWVIERVGSERASWVYPFKSIIDSGIVVGISTDAPVEPVNPWETVYAAVTRGAFEGLRLYEYSPNEVLDVADVLHYYTYGSAQLLHSEDEVGTLEPGRYADLIVISEDPLGVSPKELKDIKVLATLVGGELTYSSGEIGIE